ncbi:MAG TPA: TetR/AcrR family transcriptional regulator [Acidimicrobiales bacterium]|nr:TetR/AcrR family transcriptional regulator [Acidimicrobiales bacterium]
MARNRPTADAPATDGPGSWRELAVARSLDPARARAEERVQRFLDAAVELMMENDTGKDFTVQDVVERSGQSLRSFYQYFAGKHELLLALFEESVRSTAEHLQQMVDEVDDPFERLHRFVVEHYLMCRPQPRSRSTQKSGPTPAAMAEFGQKLLTEHPKEASRAFVPVVSLFEQLLDEAAAAGAIRSGLQHRAVAGVALQAIMFNAFAATISGISIGPDGLDPADQLWNLFIHGIGLGHQA